VTVAAATQVKELNQRLRHKHITLELTMQSLCKFDQTCHLMLMSTCHLSLRLAMSLSLGP